MNMPEDRKPIKSGMSCRTNNKATSHANIKVVRRFRSVAVHFLPLCFLVFLPVYAPWAGECGMGNACPTLGSLTINPGTVGLGQSAQVSASASDDKGLTRIDFSASAGTFPNGASVSVSGVTATATTTWIAPSVVGTYTITARAWDNGGLFSSNPASGSVSVKTISVTVSVLNAAPVITGLTANPTQLFTGETASLLASAFNPDGDPITYAWTSTAGTILPGSRGSAAFQAPTDPAAVTVTCTVTDNQGADTQATVTISVSDALPERMVTNGLLAPQRIATDSAGNLYVVDGATSTISVYDGSAGSPESSISVPGVTSIACDWADRLLVGRRTGAILISNGQAGHPLNLRQGPGPVTDVAVDLVSQRYLVLYGVAGKVAVFNGKAKLLFTFGSNGDGPGEFRGATALAVTPTSDILVGDTGHGLIQRFDPAGAYLSSFGGLGSQEGKFTQLAGLAVDTTGHIYASDGYQSRVQVFNADGSLREVIGEYGDNLGQFRTPAGVCYVAATGELVVASINASRLDVFRLSPQDTDRPPSVPVPQSPPDGSSIVVGYPVVLTVANAADPEGQPILYDFELYINSGGWSLVKDWEAPEGAATTSVDATSFVSVSGSYRWRVRAFDGVKHSNWSANQSFQTTLSVPVNHPPSVPVPSAPDGGVEVAGLSPTLVAANAVDPDGDRVTYVFETALLIDGAYQMTSVSPLVPGGAGTTSWTVPASTLRPSQMVYWRCRAYDGTTYGNWSGWAGFWSPPFSIPEAQEVGLLPSGDRSRPGEIHYEMDGKSVDTTVYFQLFNVSTTTDVTLLVNGQYTHAIPAQVANDWSHTVSVTIPVAELNAGSANRINVVHDDLVEDWGVRKMALTPPPSTSPVITARAYNTVIDIAWNAQPVLVAGTLVKLYRSTSASGPFVPMGAFDLHLGLVRDTGLVNDVTYHYLATYVDTNGIEGPASAQVSATPLAANGVTPITDLKVVKSGGDLKLTWTPITSSPALQYIEIYSDSFSNLSPDTSTFSNEIGTVSPLDGQFIVVGGAVSGTNAWYSAIPLDTTGARGTP